MKAIYQLKILNIYSNLIKSIIKDIKYYHKN